MILSIDPHITKPYAWAMWIKDDEWFCEFGKSTSIRELSIMVGAASHVYIENQYGGINKKTLTDLSHSAGKIMGLCELKSVKYTLVMPTVWQSKIGLSRKHKEISKYQWDKHHKAEMVLKAFEVTGKSIEDDDIASAVLIGYSMGVM